MFLPIDMEEDKLSCECSQTKAASGIYTELQPTRFINEIFVNYTQMNSVGSFLNKLRVLETDLNETV